MRIYTRDQLSSGLKILLLYWVVERLRGILMPCPPINVSTGQMAGEEIKVDIETRHGTLTHRMKLHLGISEMAKSEGKDLTLKQEEQG